MNSIPPAELNDAVSRYRVDSSSKGRTRPYSKNVSGACQPSLSAVCVRNRALNYSWENTPSLIRKFGTFATLYKSTSKHIPRTKCNSTSRVHHVASKLSEIVGNFPNFITRTKIASCADVAAYSDVEWMCLIWGELIVNYCLIFRVTFDFSQDLLC